MRFIIKEILFDKWGNSIGLFPVGNFAYKDERDKAFEKHILDNPNRKGFKVEE